MKTMKLWAVLLLFFSAAMSWTDKESQNNR